MQRALRPQSAKPGRLLKPNPDQLDWDSEEDSIRDRIGSSKLQGRPSKMMLTNDYGRLIPKNFLHDKEQLYSQAIKLKQQTNATTDENIKLKTRIAVLEKQRLKILHMLESQLRQKTNRQHSYGHSHSELATSIAENNKLQQMKRLLAEAREEAKFLKNQLTTIKKSVKYTKLEEGDIQKRMILEQSSRLRRIIDNYEAQLDERNDMADQLEDIEKELSRRIAEVEEHRIRSKKYQIYIEELEKKVKETESKMQQQERKLQRELKQTKKKMGDMLAETQMLRREISSSNRNYVSNTSSNSRVTSDSTVKRMAEQLMILKGKNAELQKQINERQKKQETQNHGRKRPETAHNIVKKQKTFQSNEQRQQVVEPIQYKNRKADVNQRRKDDSVEILAKMKDSPKKHEKQETKEIYKNLKQSPPKPENKRQRPTSAVKSVEPRKIQPLKIKQEEEYAQEFEGQTTPRIDDVQKYAEQRTLENRQQASRSSTRTRFRQLGQIRQLLTYRFKAQRYRYEDIKRDVDQSAQMSFQLADVADLLSQPPFYLSGQYLHFVLQFMFDSNDLSVDMKISKKSFIDKMRHLIDDFHMVSQEQEKQVIDETCNLIDSQKGYLMDKFDKKAPSGNISKDALEEIFQALSMSKQAVDIILSQLALHSKQMKNLKWHAIFQYFTMGDQQHEEMYEVAEESEQSGDSKTLLSKKREKHPSIIMNQQYDSQKFQQEDEYQLESNQDPIELSMRGGHKGPIDYEILSDEDLHI